ncbi:predicted protein [Arabidopsis lyrata subsp. lyrata]|uniref:Predicted protein n=1 Tax=Arabidopsis lyrata subsp. lyrata TaxID=81972 RepID=D7KP18_ARALL|nr:predicted protein [Arabidopsis lyrata subsp. lyrata]
MDPQENLRTCKHKSIDLCRFVNVQTGSKKIDETAEHLFFNCNYVSQIWIQYTCKNPLIPGHVPSFRSALEASKFMTCLPPTSLGGGPLFPSIIWSILSARNTDIQQSTTGLADYYLKSQHRLPLKRPAESRLHPNLIIYNTYVTWKDNNSSEFGWIFSTKSGRKVDYGSTLAPIISSPLMAEATVVFLAIQHAHNLGVNHLYIASDSSQLIKALHSEVQHKELHEILNDIFSISFNFVVIS